jgi:hypothetical protein
VLIVHGPDANVAGVVPGEKGQMSLRRSLLEISVGSSRIIPVIAYLR